jgi:hypothetical protein
VRRRRGGQRRSQRSARRGELAGQAAWGPIAEQGVQLVDRAGAGGDEVVAALVQHGDDGAGVLGLDRVQADGVAGGQGVDLVGLAVAAASELANPRGRDAGRRSP